MQIEGFPSFVVDELERKHDDHGKGKGKGKGRTRTRGRNRTRTRTRGGRKS